MGDPFVWSRFSRASGQGMTEYIIIVALIAIAAIGVYSFFGQTVRQPAPGTTPDPSGKVVAKEGAPAQPAAKPDPKGAADSKRAVVAK